MLVGPGFHVIGAVRAVAVCFVGTKRIDGELGLNLASAGIQNLAVLPEAIGPAAPADRSAAVIRQDAIASVPRIEESAARRHRISLELHKSYRPRVVVGGPYDASCARVRVNIAVEHRAQLDPIGAGSLRPVAV